MAKGISKAHFHSQALGYPKTTKNISWKYVLEKEKKKWKYKKKNINFMNAFYTSDRPSYT